MRAESRHGKRLNPRKADMHRWRETFAEKLRGHGIEAEATRQATRGQTQICDSLWRVKALQDGRLRSNRPREKSSTSAKASRSQAVEAWMQIGLALVRSDDLVDRRLASSIQRFVMEMTPNQAPTLITSARKRPEISQADREPWR